MRPDNNYNVDNSTEGSNQGLTKRPARRHRKPASDQLLGLRNVLNAVFMLLAIVGVAIYLWGDATIGTYVIIAGMALKMVECCLRMLK